MLGNADLQDWADEGDVVRAEIRLLPVIARFASDPAPMEIILGNDLSGRLRAFIKGRNLNVVALRCLLADLKEAGRSAAPEGRRFGSVSAGHELPPQN
jgi:hypothetical protein